MSAGHQAGALRVVALLATLVAIRSEGHAMQDNRQRLAVRIFRIIEGEAEGPLAILVFLILALTAIAVTVWFRS
jgi:hypothetical protein